jgi:urease accessory protein
MTRRPLYTALILAAMATTVEAHTGVGGTSAFLQGFGHPPGGVDHVLAMVAVGLFAAHLGGRALWFVPASFVSMMAVGGTAGIAGFELPFIEAGIGLSVVVLGVIIALQWSAPVSAAMAIVGFLAVFQGFAHGAEMPADAAGLNYASGLVLATALLHATGIGLGIGIGRLTKIGVRRIAQSGGGAMALAGVGILTGAL